MFQIHEHNLSSGDIVKLVPRTKAGELKIKLWKDPIVRLAGTTKDGFFVIVNRETTYITPHFSGDWSRISWISADDFIFVYFEEEEFNSVLRLIK